MEYGTLISQAAEMMREEPWYASAMSNLSALLMTSLPDLNWAGFYLMRDGRLTVGPFQGKPISGDRIRAISASASEIVIPIHRDGEVTAVLDIDSPRLSRFSGEDARGLEALVTEMEKSLRWD